MLTVYNCIVTAHDVRLVALAVTICALASYTAISLLHHVRRSTGRMRFIWLVVSAMTTGFGIWATHFIAMLAFAPGLPTAYHLGFTLLSLVAAVVLTGIGLSVAITADIPGATWLGGAVVGVGIATMHYLGMAAFEVEGRLVWDPILIEVSILCGVLFGAAALPVGLHGEKPAWTFCGALLMTGAICGLHFTAMGAVSIVPDPTVEFSRSSLPVGWLATAVAIASFIIILLALAGVAVDMRDRRRLELEAERMRGLANAAVEGLLVCKGRTIVTVNDNFANLVGASADALAGVEFDRFVPAEGTRLKLAERPNQLIEGEVHRADGTVAPVELILRPIDFDGTPHVAIAVRDLQAHKEAEQHIRFLAHYDALTGVPNRSSFNKKLDQEIQFALTTGRRLAVLCLDLDRFKEVNDLFGHAAGDRMLQSVAARVSNELDDSQVLARLSGDEFAIIMPDLFHPMAAGRLAESILETLRLGNDNAETDASASTSIGIAVCPDDATDRQTLLSHADTALYRAKSEGRGTYRFFEAEMAAAVRERRMLEHDLRNAIARGQLSLVYQPQKNVVTGEVIGLEALLRWSHPTRGEVPPTEFIPIAEETGAILAIGEWVLRKACREAATWTRPLTVAVNVSAVQIYNANFPHMIHEVLFETELAPSRLELEITETALVRDLNRALATLRRIKVLGVHIAMDDFGTGYSSLSNLRAFPFDKIKIDGSFIKSVNADEQSAAIVRSVLGLGRALGFPVLAEGVETPAELEFLMRERCDEVQGYLLAIPDKIETFRHLTHGEAAAETTPVVVPFVSRTSFNG
jgi:diguanylate cyclase (GGDEF)-like protein/PAS domain S-box-containing protein